MAKVIFRRKKFDKYCKMYYEQQHVCFNMYTGSIKKVGKALKPDTSYTVSASISYNDGLTQYKLCELESFGFLPSEWFDEPLMLRLRNFFSRI